MDGASRPRRSVLYVPAINERALAKARTLPADALILDLEDAVAPALKERAREIVCAELAAGGFAPREVVLRINAPETPWYEDDVRAAAAARVDAVLLPKVERAEALQAVEGDLAVAGLPAHVALWCMIETPRGVLRAADIAGASPRLAALVMGTSDLVKDLHARHTPARTEVLTALGLCVLAARAHDLAVLDGVHLDLDDLAGFEAACVQAKDLGFDGKTLIHPKTIDIANRVFAPSADELAWSERVVDAHAAAVEQGRGVVVVDGRLVENLHVEYARRLLALAAAIRP